VEEELFIVAKAVKGIEDGEVLGFVSVEGGWKDDAVGDAAGEDFAGERVAFEAAGGGEDGEVEEVNEVKEGKEVEERTDDLGV